MVVAAQAIRVAVAANRASNAANVRVLPKCFIIWFEFNPPAGTMRGPQKLGSLRARFVPRLFTFGLRGDGENNLPARLPALMSACKPLRSVQHAT